MAVQSTPSSLEPSWLKVARLETGVSEIPGVKHNPRILEYFAATTNQATTDETPWCSAFVNWVILKTGMHPTKLANARSWLKWGTPLQTPKLGSIVVFSSDDRGPDAGHVGFYLGQSQGKIKVFGGNQLNKVGEHVYDAQRLLGYRWPTMQQIKLSDSILRPVLMLLAVAAAVYVYTKA